MIDAFGCPSLHDRGDQGPSCCRVIVVLRHIGEWDFTICRRTVISRRRRRAEYPMSDRARRRSSIRSVESFDTFR